MADVDSMIGWYGKTPSTGDFVSRRLARPTLNEVDRWCEVGMLALRERAPDTWERAYASAPTWNALVPARVIAPHACLVAVAASSDRVGRRFPFCVVASPPQPALAGIASLGEYGEAVSTLVEQSTHASIGMDEFDARLSALAARYFDGGAASTGDSSDIGAVLDELAIDATDLVTVPFGAHAAFPWPDLARTFEPAGTTSYWWGHRASAPLPGGFTHRGTLAPSLFVMLFGERAVETPTSEAAR
jgi:type VI secretion system protein ImpM